MDHNYLCIEKSVRQTEVKLSEIKVLFFSLGHYRFPHSLAVEDLPNRVTCTITLIY
jgi:hypothetical protein